MNSRQISSTKLSSSYRDTNHLIPNKFQHISNKQKESIDGSIKIEGRNSLLISKTESNDNINRINKKSNLIKLNEQNNKNHIEILLDLIEQSLKQIDEYRFKINNLFFQKSTNQLNQTNNLLKFPQKPNIPIELIGKLNENNLDNLIINSNIDQLNEINPLIGRFQITNSMNPKSNFHLNEQIINENFSLNIFEYLSEYSNYFNSLLDKYINNDIYENLKSKINSLALSEQIKDFFKKIYHRYKIIVQVYIQQHLDQTILIASRSLWDKTYDQFLQKKFQKNNIIVIIIVFFIYKQ